MGNFDPSSGGNVLDALDEMDNTVLGNISRSGNDGKTLIDILTKRYSDRMDKNTRKISNLEEAKLEMSQLIDHFRKARELIEEYLETENVTRELSTELNNSIRLSTVSIEGLDKYFFFNEEEIPPYSNPEFQTLRKRFQRRKDIVSSQLESEEVQNTINDINEQNIFETTPIENVENVKLKKRKNSQVKLKRKEEEEEEEEEEGEGEKDYNEVQGFFLFDRKPQTVQQQMQIKKKKKKKKKNKIVKQTEESKKIEKEIEMEIQADLLEVDRDMNEVTDILKDMSSLVELESQKIEKIEETIDDTEEDLEKGRKHVSRSRTASGTRLIKKVVQYGLKEAGKQTLGKIFKN